MILIRQSYLVLSFILVTNTLYSQSAEFFNFSGRLGFFYDFYDASASNYESFRPRYPNNLGRFSAHATLSAGKYFSMPVGIDFSMGQATYHLPQIPEERLIDYVRNPRNNIHINPQYKWAQAWLGTHTPSLSALTTGDIPIFGAGLELNPGKFIFSAHYGISQIGIHANPVENIAGAYQQSILASRMGFGRMNATHFIVNFVRLKDDISSVDQQPAGLQPKEGIVVSPVLQISLSPSLTFATETAASAFTRDLLGPDLFVENNFTPLAESLLNVNGSTYIDFSNISSVDWKTDQMGLGLEVRYIGPGFEPVGFRAMERDIIDYNLKSNFNFFNKKVIVNGTTGIRTNNLQNTTLQSTRRFIANLNLFAQVSEAFSLNSNYANFGFRNNVLFDTLKVEMIQNMFTLSPTVQLKGDAVNHIIGLGATYQFFDEFNVFTAEFNSTKSMSFMGNYNIVFKNAPLNLGLMGMYLENTTPVSELNLYNIRLMARYRLLDKKLIPRLMLSYTGVQRNEYTPDKRIQIQLNTSYKISKAMEIKVNYSLSNYVYGSFRPDAKTTEHRVNLSIQQRF
jgi:hypothetical protein